MGEIFKLDIKGCCVSREAFNYHDKSQDITFEVDNYYFQKPLKVMLSKRINQPILLESLEKEITKNLGFSFVARGIKKSFTKSFFHKNQETKYLLIDFLDERCEMLEVPIKNNETSYIEFIERTEKVVKEYNLKKYVDTIDEKLKLVEKYLNKCIELYGIDNIIIHRAYCLYKTKVDGGYYPIASLTAGYVNDKSFILEKINKINNEMVAIYEFIEKKFPNIKCIDLDINEFYCPYEHFYNYMPLHYCDEYYQVFIKTLIKTIKNYNHDNDVYLSNIETVKKFNSLVMILKPIQRQAINPELIFYKDKLKRKVKYFLDDNIFITGSVSINCKKYDLYYKNNIFIRIEKEKDIIRLIVVNPIKQLLLTIGKDDLYFNNDLKELIIKPIKMSDEENITQLIYNNIILNVVNRRNREVSIIVHRNGIRIFRIDFLYKEVEKIFYFKNKNIIKELNFKKFISFGLLERYVEREDNSIKLIESYNPDGSLRYWKDKKNKEAITKVFYRNNLVKMIKERNEIIYEIIKYNAEGKLINKLYLENGIPVRKVKYNKNECIEEEIVVNDE